MAKTAKRARVGAGPLGHSPLVARVRSEQGIALPAAIMMMLAVASLGAAIASGAITASNESVRDRSIKRAVAAVDAGLATALYRQNKIAAGAEECVVVGAGGLQLEPVQTDGWCREQTEDLGDGASYDYRVSAGRQVTVDGQPLLQRTIVSSGRTGSAKRRALATVGSAYRESVFGTRAVIGLDDLSLDNNSTIAGNAASNGDIYLRNSAEICGNATPGPGKAVYTFNSARVCPGFSTAPATEPFVLNPVDQGDAPTVNDNARIGTLDPWSPQQGSSWDPAARALTLRNDATLTLTGNRYSFCALTIENNAQIVIGPRSSGTPLQIYMDAPENCPQAGDPGSVVLQNNGSIYNATADPTTFELYLVGSSARETRVEFSNHFTPRVNVVVYAPQSSVVFRNNTDLLGALAAKQIRLENSAKVTGDSRVDGVNGGLVSVYERQTWVECSPERTGPAPDSGC